MSSGSATRIICDKHNMNLIACGCGFDAAAAKYAMSGDLTGSTPKPTVNSIIAYCGSFRRMAYRYWSDLLTAEEESIIEDRIPKETLCAYKPVR